MEFTYNLSLKQMNYIFFICSRIEEETGEERESLREKFKQNFCKLQNIDYFSCSPYQYNSISRENASLFIDYILKCAKEKGVIL